MNAILSSLTCDKNSLDIDATGVAGLSFSGYQIQSATVLLREGVNNAKTSEAAAQHLKAANVLEQNTTGFMSACVGQGFQYYRAKGNVEADALERFFPVSLSYFLSSYNDAAWGDSLLGMSIFRL